MASCIPHRDELEEEAPWPLDRAWVNLDLLWAASLLVGAGATLFG